MNGSTRTKANTARQKWRTPRIVTLGTFLDEDAATVAALTPVSCGLREAVIVASPVVCEVVVNSLLCAEVADSSVPVAGECILL